MVGLFDPEQGDKVPRRCALITCAGEAPHSTGDDAPEPGRHDPTVSPTAPAPIAEPQGSPFRRLPARSGAVLELLFEDGAASVLGPEDLFDGFPESLSIFQAVQQEVSVLGESSVTVTKSQVAFRRRKSFAFLWRPGQYIASAVPAVLSIALPNELVSDRFKEIAHPAPNVWMHHLELEGVADIDDEVAAWLAEAFANAD